MPNPKKRKPLKRKSIRVDGVFDIECWGWSNFLLGVTLSAAGEVNVWGDAESMFGFLYGVGGHWWAHNGGKYDILQALDVLRLNGVTQSISLANSRVTRTMGGGLVMRDSYALIPLGLEYVAELGGAEVPKLWFDCKCAKECGGYCRLGPRMRYYWKERVRDYCVQDCKALFAGLSKLSEIAESHDLDLVGTVGGSSWATARRVLGIPDADFPAAQWRAIRSAYFGGRTTVFRPMVSGVGSHWDIGSAYPAALAESLLPVGQPSELGHTEATRALAHDRPGIYSCTIRVPESHVPSLPWGWGEGVAFPVGVVSGSWALPDILEAVSMGCSVDSVEWAIVWDSEERIFGDWINRIYTLRARYGKKTVVGEWLRLFPNSICGKFAERPDKRFLRMNPDPKEIVHCDGRPPCTLTSCICGSWEQVDQWGAMWSVPFWKMSESSHVHWAAYLTANSRIRHAAQVRADPSPAYCATDSLWTTSTQAPSPSGDGLGEWSRKCGFLEWEGVAPNAYAYTDEKTGERIISYAGALLGVDEWTKGEASQDRGVLSVLDAARSGRGLFQRAHRRFTLPRHGEWYGDRRLSAVNGTTVPVTCSELRTRLREREQRRRDRRDSGQEN